MPIVKMFAALLFTAGAMQTLATQARAETPIKIESSIRGETLDCGWRHDYHYRYHYRPYHPNPYRRPRTPRPRRKVRPEPE